MSNTVQANRYAAKLIMQKNIGWVKRPEEGFKFKWIFYLVTADAKRYSESYFEHPGQQSVKSFNPVVVCVFDLDNHGTYALNLHI